MPVTRAYLPSVLLAILVTACGEVPRPGVQAHGRPIINGVPDTSIAHMAVVAVQSSSSYCSGILVAPRVVLTAGHCVEGEQADNFLVMFGNRMEGALTRSVAEAGLHPDYEPIDLGHPPRNDIGALLLASAVPPGVTPVPNLPAALGVTEADIGVPLEFVGFGDDEWGNSGTKLTVTTPLDIVCTEPGDCPIGGYTAVRYSLCTDQNPGGPCSGDSGGPAFLLRGGSEYVAGLSSYGTENCLLFGCSTKVDEFETFIADFARGRLGSPCTFDADCRSGFCVENVCCDGRCAEECQGCDLPGSAGTCRQALDGAPCPDGDRCNGDESCTAGICLAGEPLICVDGDPCTEDLCDPQAGCQFPGREDGAPCDNEDVCDGRETCRAGACQGGPPPVCDDQNPCTEDYCHRLDGCLHSPLADGSPCGHGACGPMICTGGECRPGDPSGCDDGDPCTQDACDPETGCIHAPAKEGQPCGDCRLCQQGRCVDDPACGCGCGHTRGGLAGLLGLLLLFTGSSPGRRRPWHQP